MDLELAGRTIMITGAGGGIGRAVARTLVAEGARVVLTDRTAPVSLAAELRDAGGDAVALAADVADEASIAAAVAAASAHGDGIDGLVGCAGVSGPVGTALTDTTLAEWQAVFAVNVTGAFLTLRGCLPLLERSALASVVFVASDSALVCAPGMAPYCASKAALVQLARAASVEHPSVRVNAVSPSIVDTPMSRGDLEVDDFADADFPVHRAEDVAAQIAFLLSPRSRGVDAAILLADFGYSTRSSFPA